MKDRIKAKALEVKRKFASSNPFEIAKQLNIYVQFGDFNFDGCYMYLKKHRCIFLNENLKDGNLYVVMAHELGHALLHIKQNCYFIREKTLLSTSKFEIEANKFAIELLVDDQIIDENRNYTIDQLSRMLGYDETILRLKF